jgi:hypothetical protein
MFHPPANVMRCMQPWRIVPRRSMRGGMTGPADRAGFFKYINSTIVNLSRIIIFVKIYLYISPTFRAAMRDATGDLLEVLNLNPPLKKAIILLLHQTFVKVLKDALGHLGPYQTLTKVWCNDSGARNTVHLPATIQI